MLRNVSSKLLAVALTGVAGSVFAQEPPKAPPLADIPPPPRLTEKPATADDQDATTITIRQEGGNKIEEFHTKGGRVYAVRVTPTIGKPYMLFNPDGTGTEFPASELSDRVRPAQWTIFEF
jgi:Protein of unknown function (DUF2782)